MAIAAASIAATPSPHLELELAGLPDPARYRLVVEPPASVAFDPLRTWLPARLRPECPDLGACFDVGEPPPPPPPSPVLDYRPRDWRSLRQALVEYVLRRDPDADVSIADPTITVAELFAHVGDLLNYRLDRVATESYLETARLRTSVRRHARLVDFAVDDGAAAETFVHVTVAPNASHRDRRRGQRGGRRQRLRPRLHARGGPRRRREARRRSRSTTGARRRAASRQARPSACWSVRSRPTRWATRGWPPAT